ncbi:glycoside transferase family 32 [Pedobacter ginsengisoli]|uniref:Glycoside transferase family 32 n=2 Tax=Pedobacter ginsengisoli TaxID=363852 RepID=A0A2D1U198_9SPHI|nr:glycoside transferase family 32 [Pedobacter ginsengisoli]
MNREFIKRFFPDFLLQYDSYEKNIQRVDAVRYFILYKIGGVFIDMDFECLKNIEPLISDCDSVFGLEPREHCEQFRKNKIICNAFMATKPENDFFKTICSILPSYTWKNEESYIKNILSTAGPFALTDIYNNYERKEEIKLLSSNFIYPLTVNESRRAINDDIDDSIQEKIDDAYAVHYFLGSWH